MVKRKKMGIIDIIAIFLVSLGAVNWLLLAWFKLNLVEKLSWGNEWVALILYTIIGLFGAWGLWVVIKAIKEKLE